MASTPDTVNYICDQADLGAALSHRKMFGEYALYLHGKVVALVCDNRVFLKPTDAARALLGVPAEAPPYPGAKNHFLLQEELEDRDLLQQLLRVTEASLPPPKPKAPRSSTSRLSIHPPKTTP